MCSSSNLINEFTISLINENIQIILTWKNRKAIRVVPFFKTVIVSSYFFINSNVSTICILTIYLKFKLIR